MSFYIIGSNFIPDVYANQENSNEDAQILKQIEEHENQIEKLINSIEAQKLKLDTEKGQKNPALIDNTNNRIEKFEDSNFSRLRNISV